MRVAALSTTSPLDAWGADRSLGGFALIAALIVSVVPAWNAHADGLPSQQNLLVNGSFEDGPKMAPDTFRPLDEDSTEIKGWVVTRGQIDLLNGTWQTTHGQRSLDLHGSPGFGGVKQTIKTSIGQKYRVTFSMSGTPLCGYKEVQLQVRAAGQGRRFVCPIDGKTQADMKWQRQTWDFTADATTTTLEFHTAMAPTSNPYGGPVLDDVAVTPVEAAPGNGAGDAQNIAGIWRYKNPTFGQSFLEFTDQGNGAYTFVEFGMANTQGTASLKNGLLTMHSEHEGAKIYAEHNMKGAIGQGWARLTLPNETRKFENCTLTLIRLAGEHGSMTSKPGALERKSTPVQPMTRAELNLSGDWTYADGQGKAHIGHQGDKVRMELTWTPSMSPGPHYRIEATLLGGNLKGTWEAIGDYGKGDRGIFYAVVGVDGATIAIVKTEDLDNRHQWNSTVLTAPKPAWVGGSKIASFEGTWRGKCGASEDKAVDVELRIDEKGGSLRGAWAGLTLRGERTGPNTFFFLAESKAATYRGTGQIDAGKLVLFYSAPADGETRHYGWGKLHKAP